MKEKTHHKELARVHTTKSQYKSLNNIITDDGGFDCKAAVAGGIMLAQQCTLMGAPWVTPVGPQNQFTTNT